MATSRAEPDALRDKHANEFILYLQRNMPEGLSRETQPDLYDIWHNAVEQSHTVFEASFDIPAIDVYEFTDIPREERYEWLTGVPLMVKMSTKEIFEGVAEILEEFDAFLESQKIKRTTGDDGVRNSRDGRGNNESYIDDPTWADSVQDDGDEEDALRFDCKSSVAPNSSSIPIRQGADDKVSDQDDASFANRRRAFLQRHIGNNPDAVERHKASQLRNRAVASDAEAMRGGRQGGPRRPNPMLAEIRKAAAASKSSSASSSAATAFPAGKSNKKEGKKNNGGVGTSADTAEVPRYKTPSADIDPRYNVPLAQHPLFQSAITEDKWATFNEEEKTEVYRVVTRLQTQDGVQIPDTLTRLLEDDACDRRLRARNRRPQFSGDRLKEGEEPISTFTTTKDYKMLPHGGMRGMESADAGRAQRGGVAPRAAQFAAAVASNDDDDDDDDVADAMAVDDNVHHIKQRNAYASADSEDEEEEEEFLDDSRTDGDVGRIGGRKRGQAVDTMDAMDAMDVDGGEADPFAHVSFSFS